MKILYLEQSANDVTGSFSTVLRVLREKFGAQIDTIEIKHRKHVVFKSQDNNQQVFAFNESIKLDQESIKNAYNLIEILEKKFPGLLKKILLIDRQIGRNQFIHEICYVGNLDVTTKNENLLTNTILAYLNFTHQILSINKYDMVLGSSGNFKSDLFALMSDYFAIPFWEVFYSRVRGDKTPFRYFTNNYIKFNFLENQEYFEQIKISESSRKYLDSIKEKRSNKYLVHYKQNWVKFFKNFLSDIKWAIKNTEQRQFYIDKLKDKLAFAFRYSCQRKILSNVFLGSLNQETKSKSALIAFFQHPEIVVLSWADEYASHVDFVNKVLKNLPLNWLLNIREHPHNVGRRPKQFMHWIRTLRNTRLVSLDESQYVQLNKSSACLTINGTIGWESLILNKPVFTFGRTFFDLTNLNFKISNYKELNNIEEMIKKFNDKLNNYEMYQDRLLRLITFDELACFSLEDDSSIEKMFKLVLAHPYKNFWDGK